MKLKAKISNAIGIKQVELGHKNYLLPTKLKLKEFYNTLQA